MIYDVQESCSKEDDEEDGPILYRDEDNMEDEDRLAAKLARKESLSTKLEQRPGRQELIDRNILYQVGSTTFPGSSCFCCCFLSFEALKIRFVIVNF